MPAPPSAEDLRTANSTKSPHSLRESEEIAAAGARPRRGRATSVALQFQNVRLMPAAHTCTCARYNGWGTTNVPITKRSRYDRSLYPPGDGTHLSSRTKYTIWQEIEVLACEAQAELGKDRYFQRRGPVDRDHANFEKAKVDEIEEVTRHDVIAFLTNMKEYIDADVPEGDPKPSRWVHYGMTSSDRATLCYQLTQACDLIIEDVKKLGEICKRRAFEERNTLCAGRTHGIHAEPMTFGMKFGSWAWELKRDLDRLEDARKNVAFGAISGAVGTYSSIEPFVEEYVCEHLGWFTTRCPRRLLAASSRLPRRRSCHHRGHL